MNKNEVIEQLITKVEDPEEPLFLLRGRDPLASVCVLRWAHEAKEANINPVKVRQAEDVALEMLSYARKRLPD